VLQYQKNVRFTVLNKKIITNYNCYTVELESIHLTHLGFNINSSYFLKKSNNLIILNKLALIRISSSTGNFCLSKKCDALISKNVRQITKNLNSKFFINN